VHLWMVVFSVLIGIGVRWFILYSNGDRFTDGDAQSGDSQYEWRILSAFLIPPLLLLATASALLQMGTTGTMLGVPVGRIGFVLGLGFLSSAGGLALYLGFQGWRSLQQVRTYPCITIDGYPARILETELPFAGQVGFWNPELVVSQALLDVLTPEQVAAVLAHEDAHAHYHDTFWFFWLGWLRSLTGWLPQTQTLWQELLLLREIRADRWATQVQSVDPLVLAESLLHVVRLSSHSVPINCAAFHLLSSTHRLTVRVNALLASSDNQTPTSAHFPWQFCIVWWPLLAIALHH